jgi:hypothetical protein
MQSMKYNLEHLYRHSRRFYAQFLSLLSLQNARFFGRPLSYLWLVSLLSILSLPMSCAPVDQLDRPIKERGTVGAVALSIARTEAHLSARVPQERVTRLKTEGDLFKEGVDQLWSWDQIQQMSADLFEWSPFLDDGWGGSILAVADRALAMLEADEVGRSFLVSDALSWRLASVSPQAPSLLSLLLISGWSASFGGLIEWLSLHDAHPNLSTLQDAERSGHLLTLMAYGADALRGLKAFEETSWGLWAMTVLLETDPLLAGSSTTWAVGWGQGGRRPLFSEPNESTVEAAPLPFDTAHTPLEMNVVPQVSRAVTRDAWGRALTSAGAIGYPYFVIEESLLHALLRAVSATWNQGLLWDLQRLLERALPQAELISDPLLNTEIYAYPHLGALTPVLRASLRTLDHPALSLSIRFISLILPYNASLIAQVIDLWERGQRSIDDFAPPLQGDVRWREGDLIPDLIDALADLNTFPDGVTLSALDEGSQGGEASLSSSPQEASVLWIDTLLEALKDPIWLQLEPIMHLLLTGRAYPQDILPPPEGRYNQCASACEETLDQGALGHYLCLRQCPIDELFMTQDPLDLQTQSFLERALALIHDHAGHPYEMRVTTLSSPLFSGARALDPALMPPLLEIDDVAATFLSSVAGAFQLKDHVGARALTDPQIDSLLEGFDVVCAEGDFANDLFNALLPQLTQVDEPLLRERCQRYTHVRATQRGPEGKRGHIAVIVTLLSLLTDVPMSETPTTGQLLRFFNLSRPMIDLGLLSVGISPLICKAGYPLYQHHGLALFAGEAAGLFDLLRPVTRVAARFGKLPALARFMATIYRHYNGRTRGFNDAQGRPAASSDTALVYLEPHLEVIFDQTAPSSLIPPLLSALHADGVPSDVADQWGSPPSALALGDRAPPVAWSADRWRDLGLSDALWATLPVERRQASALLGLSLYHLLRPHENRERVGYELWRSVEGLIDLWSAPEVEPSLSKVGRALGDLFALSPNASRPTLADRQPLIVIAHLLRALGARLDDLSLRATDVSAPRLSDIESALDDVLTHPITFAALQLFNDARRLGAIGYLDALLAPLWSQPLTLSAFTLTALHLCLTENIETLPPAIALLIDPLETRTALTIEQGLSPEAQRARPAQAWPIPLRLIRASLIARAQARWSEWEGLISKALSSPSTSDVTLGERAPLIKILSALSPLLRIDPLATTPWRADDLKVALSDLRRWLIDPRTGVMSALTMISKRKRSMSTSAEVD